MYNLGDSKAYIKFTDVAIISMENTNPISSFSKLEISPKIWIAYGVKTGQPVAIPENGP